MDENTSHVCETPSAFTHSTAIHEAGHAIVALTLGFYVERIEKVQGAHTLIGTAAYLLAGMFAEKRVVRSQEFAGFCDDLQRAITVLTPLMSEPEEDDDEEAIKAATFATLDIASMLSKAIIASRWADIEHLAARLTEDPMSADSPEAFEMYIGKSPCKSAN